MMLKRRVIKIITAVVALGSYALGSIVCSFMPLSLAVDDLHDVLGFFFWQESGALCLLNSFIWILAVFLLGLSLIGFFGILPVIYCKMYSLGVSVTAAAIIKGQDSFMFLVSFLPEILLMFFIFVELGSGAVSFSLYIMQRLSLLPKKREQNLYPKEKLSFKEYISGGVIAFFLATLLVIYENIVIVLL